MAIKTFKRGINIPSRKHATEGKTIERFSTPKQVTIPINQHIGAPNKPIVGVGDKVIRGHKIAEAVSPGQLTVPVHASISGIVKKIEPRNLADNTDGLCIIIEAEENSGGKSEEFMTPLDPSNCSKEEALTRIREAGILGMGGAGFPTYQKLITFSDKPINLLIADGAECEPYLTADDAAMTARPDLLIMGLQIAMKITGVERAIIGLEDNKERLIPLIERELRVRNLNNISVGLCRTRYPQGGEKMLITALTGREVPTGGLPMDVGCIVQNVGTLIAIAEAFTLGKPLIDRTLTVTGGACKTPENINVPVGTLLKDLPPELIEIDYSKLAKIIFGGPMMGFAVSSTDIPIQKNTSGIVLMTQEETTSDHEDPCIRCCRCINKCPCGLSPVIINNSLDADDLDYAVKAGLMDCMECGSCAYMCPARIKLIQRFRVGKRRINMEKKHE